MRPEVDKGVDFDSRGDVKPTFGMSLGSGERILRGLSSTMAKVRAFTSLWVVAVLSMVTAGCGTHRPDRAPPKTYSQITFELAVAPEENRAFRERLIGFAPRYTPSGWPIGIGADLMQSSSYVIQVFARCRYQQMIISDLVRAAAPPARIPEYLILANKNAKCVDGLPVHARS
jgi:hypothetical protein